MNRKRYISCILVGVLMICLTNIKNISFAKALAAPTPVVSAISTSYMLGDKISINLTSTGTTKLVQYKAVLTNINTNEIQNLINGYTVKYYNPKNKYPLSFTPKAAGRYKLVITSKIGGYKENYSKSITKEFTIISNAMIISKIDPISLKTNVDEDFIFPGMVTATMKDGSKKDYAVTWDNKSFNKNMIGEQIFYGTVNEFSQKVKITVSVVDEKIISIDPITTAVNEGSEYKLPATITGKLKNGTIQAGVKWDAEVPDASKPGTYKFEGIVAGFNGKASLTLIVNPVKLSLDTIDVSNLKQIKLSFNKKLDISSINKENFRLFKGTALIGTEAELMEDNRTVVISASAVNTGFENLGRYSLAVEGVMDLNGNVIEKSIKDIIPEDLKIPEVLNVSAVGPYNILVEFSEPIRNSTVITEIKSDNRILSSSPILSGFETNRINIGLSTAMVENAKYDITLKGYMDFAGRQITQSTYPLTYKKSVESIAAKVEKVDSSYVVISFNKPVRGLTKDNFYYIDASKKAIGVFSDYKMTKAVIPSQTLSRVWVKFYDSQLKMGNTISDTRNELSILAKAGGYEILDSFGNSFSNVNMTVSAVWDKTAPEVKELKNDTESSLTLQFSENVKLGLNNIEIVDEKEGKINFVIKPNTNNRFTLELGKDYSGHKIIVALKDVEDYAVIPNKLASYTASILITDKTPPVVKGISKRFVAGLDNSLYVTFNEPVNQTALDIENYYIQNPLNNLMTRLNGKPAFHDGNKIIRIPLLDEEQKLINSGYDLFVRDIRDLYENKLAGQIIKNANITVYDSNDNRPKITKLEAISKNQLKVNFNQALKNVDYNAFLLNGRIPKSSLLSADSEGNSIITLFTDDTVQFTSGLEGASLIVQTDGTRRIENSFGLGVANGSYTSATSPVRIEDKMAPGVMIVSGVPQIYAIRGANGILDGIAILYEENIDLTKLSALSYNVKGRDIARVYTNISPQRGNSLTGKYVIIELKPLQSTSGASGAIGTVTQTLDIYDMQGNKLSPDGTWMETFN